MRINPAQQSDAISKYLNNVEKKTAKTQLEANITDTVELSEGARKYSSFLKAAKESIDSADAAEEAKVADITAKLNNNTYSVSDDQIVGSIINGMPSEGKR